jgi:uncharacterized repeat protein (TIGR03806 family)
MKWCALSVLAIVLLLSGKPEGTFDRKEKLSEYGFFTGSLAALTPASGVYPYTINSSLFSNYAEKLRFVKLPENTSATFNDSVAFEFPVGTVLIKNFYYPIDFRKPERGRKIIETRLLVNDVNGWQAYPYIWNDEQTEAYYDAAGETKAISYVSERGKKVSTAYVIPNKNQCKGCHIRDGQMKPIGPSARQLNVSGSFSGHDNQLEYWQSIKLLASLPTSNIPKLAVWDDEQTGDLNERARAYLDANCGHCHSHSGPASTSGLFLNISEKSYAQLGVNKTPVAAGRGSGNLQFDIVPGKPEQSIIVYRMKTNDPGIAMPEIGREQIHKEGVALIEEWIRKNTFVAH